MTTDPFTTAARDRANTLWQVAGEAWARRIFVEGAEWARAHLAAEVRKAQADAWDEGYGKGSSPHPFVQRNPYRATGVEKEN